MPWRGSAYWDDIRTLPRDCRVAWRYGGPVEVVLTLLERSLFRMLWGGRFLVVSAPMKPPSNVSPATVTVERLPTDRLHELGAVATAPRMRLFKRLAAAGAVCMVARSGDEVAGYVWGIRAGAAGRSEYLQALPRGLPCIRSLFVTRQHRGRGVATALILALGTEGGWEARLAPACCALVRPGNSASLKTIVSLSEGRATVIGRVTQVKVLWWLWDQYYPLAERPASP